MPAYYRMGGIIKTKVVGDEWPGRAYIYVCSVCVA